MSTIIQVTNISKQYRLGQVGTGNTSYDFTSEFFVGERYIKTAKQNKKTPVKEEIEQS